MCVWDRKAMVGLLMLLLLSTVDGLSVYEVKEGGDVLLQWDGANGTDLSSLYMTCHFTFGAPRLVLQMERGAEKTDNQDPQFSGRVRCFRESLPQGLVRILLTGLRLQDSGCYTCDMTVPSADKTKRPFFKSEDFVVNVTSHSVIHSRQPHNEDQNKIEKTQITKPFHNKRLRTVAFCAAVLFLTLAVIVFCAVKYNDHKRQEKLTYDVV